MNKRLFFILTLAAIMAGGGVFVLIPIASKNIFFALSIPFGCMFMLMMVTRPKWALVSLLSVRSVLDLLLVHTKGEASSADTGIGGILNILIIALAGLIIFQNVGETSKISRFIRFWAIFLFACFISIAFSPDKVKAIKALSQQIACLLIFLTPFFVVRDEKDKKFWLKVLLFSSVLPAAVAIFGLISRSRALWMNTEDGGLRLQGCFTHPNILAFYAVLMIVVSFYAIKSKRIELSGVQKGLLGLHILNLMVIVLATRTRSALMACGLVFFLYGLLKEKKYLFIVLALASLLMLTPQVRERMGNIFSKAPSRAELRKNSFDWRLRLWSQSMPLIREKPILGHGLTSFRILSPTFFSTAKGGTYAHNVYVELLFETGIIGLIGYLGIFLHLLKTFYSQIRDRASPSSSESAIVFSYLVGYLIVCFSDNMLVYITFNWYLFFFLGLAACSLYPSVRTERLNT
jgi:O-antigen ligase